MKKMLKRGLSVALMLIMVAGLLPLTAFAAVDGQGKPDGVTDKLVLAIYKGTGFPGEPAVYGVESYQNINSNFEAKSGTFAQSAAGELDWEKIEPDLLQGKQSGSTKVWGVYDASGAKDYFLPTASIIQRDKEAKIIRAMKSDVANMSDDEVLAKYEIIWYVIKLQSSTSWFSRTIEWHIDGVIKEREFFSINYYGNGNTGGDAPTGTTKHPQTDDYVVKGPGTMTREINGASVKFLGWSARADGSGAELAFYQEGDTISAADLKEKYNGKLSLYAMWDTTTQHTATVNTYLDNVLTDDSDIHDTDRELYLGIDGHYYPLTRSGEGVYTTKITGNGKFHLYNKNSDGTYTQIGGHQLTIYNQNGSLDVHHYTVSYNTNGGKFAADPGKKAYNYGETITAVTAEPTKEGYRFLGWNTKADGTGTTIKSGAEVTASITEPITLYAQWEKTVTVTINVTIKHEGGGGYDQMDSKDNVSLALVSRENDNSPYLEVEGKTLNLEKSNVDPEQKVTTYTGYIFKDMPGGTVDYTVVTSKSGYDTTITPKQDAQGNWVIDVVMTYNPSNFDLDFTVEVGNEVPEQYLPDAAIVKVTFWSTDRKQWEIITQQEGGAPGVRVDINPTTRSGSGSYPVWKYESNGTTPYGYRVQVTSFVYPDGTIVPASRVVKQDVAWSDNVYTATMEEVTGGMPFGTLNGAYIDNTDSQKGTLNVVITMDLHDVTFDAQGGKVNGWDKQTVEDQYKIPGFKGYVPTRDGGYTFAGWYEDAACTVPATEGQDLTKDITLYAKWIEPLTISGTVSIAGSYDQNGVDVPVNDIDRALEAMVVLQENRGGTVYDVDSTKVTFQYGADNNAEADYSFTGIPNDNKNYQIHVLVLNYGTTYENEGDNDSTYSANEFTAVFAGDNVADVDAHLTFVPPSYDQLMEVDATPIGTTFRPDKVLAEVMYRDTGDIHPFKRISQHNVEPFGVQIGLPNGTGSGTQSIWKWHTDGTLYDYQMNISQVDGNAYDSDTAPFYIVYDAPAYWDAAKNDPSGVLKATLIPKQYLISFDLNAGEDEVTGVEKLTYTDEEGNVVETDIYGVIHTWSFDTAIDAVPVRKGYNFLGWEADVADAYDDGKIPAAIHQEVTLTAQWEKKTYEVTTVADPAEGGTVTGAGTYEHGTEVTIEATPAAGYTFQGWVENGKKVSLDERYTFEVLEDRAFVAQFSLNQHTVSTEVSHRDGGKTEGAGTYNYGTEITVSATVNPGYRFLGWYRDLDYKELITEDLSFPTTVTENVKYFALFELCQYEVTTVADPPEGGTTSGGGIYSHGKSATVRATANEGYNFKGWYVDGTEVSLDKTYTFTVTADCALTAKFDPIAYQVTAKAEQGGTANGGGTYSHGQSATVKATVNATYSFDGWYEGENRVSTELEYSFTVTSDRTLTAKFIKNGYQVEARPEDALYGSTTGSGYYGEGETATVTATPNAGYAFRGWYEGTEKVSDAQSYTFTVNSNRTLIAEFAKVYTITTEASPAGAGRLTGGGQFEPTATTTISAVASGNYYFVGWYDENGLVTTDYSFEHTVVGDKTFTARFEQRVAYKCDYVYLFGYNDSQIGAEGPLLRSELAQMIYRLVKQNTGVGNGGNSFSDTAGEWFESGISYMVKVGALDGTKSNAYPHASVTRGETYKMICLGLGFTSDTSLDYSDYASILRNSGFLSGDGAVTAKIKRYEFCYLFNAILGRTHYELIDTAGNQVTHETYNYTDLDPNADYYEAMLIATSTFTNEKVDLEKRMERNTYDYKG